MLSEYESLVSIITRENRLTIKVVPCIKELHKLVQHIPPFRGAKLNKNRVELIREAKAREKYNRLGERKIPFRSNRLSLGN